MQQPTSSGQPSRLPIPSGVWELGQDLVQQPTSSGPPVQLEVPPGEWALVEVSPQEHQEIDTPDIPIRLDVPVGQWTLQTVPPKQQPNSDSLVLEAIATQLRSLTGRAEVWAAGWKLFIESPLLGYGFHADRLILRTHMHNAFMHALVQTGLIGTILFIGALVFGWGLLFKGLQNRAYLPAVHKHLLIQTTGVMTFLSVRAIFESTGAFFGVDWLVLGPLLLYLKMVNSASIKFVQSS